MTVHRFSWFSGVREGPWGVQMQKNTSKTRDGNEKRKKIAPSAQNETKKCAEVHKKYKKCAKVAKMSSKWKGAFLKVICSPSPLTLPSPLILKDTYSENLQCSLEHFPEPVVAEGTGKCDKELREL